MAWLETNAPDRARWSPIADMHAPPVDEALLLLADIRRRLIRGDGLLLHCAAGIGRSGTMAAALLITMGMSPEAAMDHVAAHRPMAGPERGVQRELLDAIAQDAG